MPNVRLYCGLASRISQDFHREIWTECELCQTGSGNCLAALMFDAVKDDESDQREDGASSEG